MVLGVQELGEVGQGATLMYVGFIAKQSKLGYLAQLQGRVVFRRSEPRRKFHRISHNCVLCVIIDEDSLTRTTSLKCDNCHALTYKKIMPYCTCTLQHLCAPTQHLRSSQHLRVRPEAGTQQTVSLVCQSKGLLCVQMNRKKLTKDNKIDPVEYWNKDFTSFGHHNPVHLGCLSDHDVVFVSS